MNEIEKQISVELDSFANYAHTNGLESPGQWTREVKNRIRKIGQSHRHTVCANGCSELVIDQDKSEWVFDLTWQKKDAEGFLAGLALAMESEWTHDRDGDADFEKLIQCRADLRLWIIHDKNEDSLRDHFDKCINMIRRFEGSQPGDRYLFAGHSNEDAKFFFQRYVYPGREIDDAIPLGPLPAFLKKLPD